MIGLGKKNAVARIKSSLSVFITTRAELKEGVDAAQKEKSEQEALIQTAQDNIDTLDESVVIANHAIGQIDQIITPQTGE